nr:hypothetical protein Iba_chr05dCG11700 [Ipomoea batatas]
MKKKLPGAVILNRELPLLRDKIGSFRLQVLKAAVRHGFSGVFGAIDHGKHDPLGAEIEGLFSPDVRRFGDAEDSRSTSSGEGAKARESVRYAAVAVLHVDHSEVVAGEAGNLSESGGEAEEENPVKSLAIPEAGFQGVNGRNEGVGEEEEMNDFLRVERENVEEEEESVAIVQVLVVREQ